MTKDIKIRNLKVTKVQETETETDNGITNKWTYTLQDEEKENTIALKTDSEREICLGDTLDVKFGNDQTTLDIHIANSEEDDGFESMCPFCLNNETDGHDAICEWKRVQDTAEKLTDTINDQGLMDKVVEEIEKRPELAEIVKEKLKEYNDLKDKKEALKIILDKAKAAEIAEEEIPTCPECGYKETQYHRTGCSFKPETEKEEDLNIEKAKAEEKGWDCPSCLQKDCICAKHNNYPFKEGATYWTIEDGKPVKSCWDKNSEIDYDCEFTESKIYYSRKKDTAQVLKDRKELLDKKKEEELDLDKKKDAIKAGKKNLIIITDEDMDDLTKKPEKELPKAEEIIIPEEIAEDLEKLESGEKKKQDGCKYYYRGGLCANTKIGKPFCIGFDDCKFIGQTEITDEELPTWPDEPEKKKVPPATPSKKKDDDPDFTKPGQNPNVAVACPKCKVKAGTWCKRPSGHKAQDIHKDRKELADKTFEELHPGKDLIENDDGELDIIDAEKKGLEDDMTEEEKKENEIKNSNDWEAKDIPSMLIKRDDFPKDLFGGLTTNATVEKHATAGTLYCNVMTVEPPNEADEDKLLIVTDKLEELSGIKWTHATGRTFCADHNQLNKIKED